MALKLIECPICGAGGGLSQAADNAEMWLCAHCKSRFTENSIEREQERIESVISSSMAGVVDDALMRRNRECYYNLRSMLWEKINAKYIDSPAIIEICREIKKLDPHDFLAEFFEIANSGNNEELVDYISDIDVHENALFLDVVLSFLTFMLSEELITPVAALLDRAGGVLSPEDKQRLLTAFEAEAVKVQSGMYEINMPRDVFLAYSSKDMKSVVEILNFIESNGLSCFAAFRNLQHGRDAVANYEKALKTAIDNSSIFVFVSSENSRSHACDALTTEIAYVRQRDMMKFPEARTYSQLPDKYKMLKIEYRLDNKPTPLADRTLKDFFHGLTYAENFDQLIERLGDCMDALNDVGIDDHARLESESKRANEAEERAIAAEKKLHEMEEAEKARKAYAESRDAYTQQMVAEAANRIQNAGRALKNETAKAAKRVQETMASFKNESVAQEKAPEHREAYQSAAADPITYSSPEDGRAAKEAYKASESASRAESAGKNESADSRSSTASSSAINTTGTKTKSFMDKFCEVYDNAFSGMSDGIKTVIALIVLFTFPVALLVPLAVKLYKENRGKK